MSKKDKLTITGSDSENPSIEIMPIVFEPGEFDRPLVDPSFEDTQRWYMEQIGLTEKDFEEIKNQRPKTSDQYT